MAINSNRTHEKDVIEIPLCSDGDQKIHIDGNWSATELCYSWCTGTGTFSDPYIIKDRVIDGQGTGSGILIENTYDYFVIENCTVFNTGDYIDNGGIALKNVDNGTLIQNNCSNNTDGNGILIDNAQNCTIKNNIISNNRRGINMYLAHYNIIEQNNVTACYEGVYIYGDFNEILKNSIINSAEYGFSLIMKNSTVSYNYVYNNQNGMRIYNGYNNTISYNNCSWNREYGIKLTNSDNNTITENNCTRNSDWAIFLALNSDFNEVYNNYLSKNAGCVYDAGTNNTIYDNICLLFGGNSPKINIDGLEPSLDWQIWGFPGSGTFYDPYIIKDKIIDGGGIGSCIQISETTKYFRIENCTLYNCGQEWIDSGINVINAANGTLFNNTCKDLCYNGISLRYSYNCSVIKNTLYNNTVGINIEGSSDSIIGNNSCYQNIEYGLRLSSSLNNSISSNECKENLGTGISLTGNSFNNIIVWNYITENLGDGLGLVGSDNSSVSINTIIKNHGWGVSIVSDNVSINNNNCSLNERDGIRLFNSKYCSIFNNNITLNEQWGLNLDSGSEFNDVFSNYFYRNIEGCINDAGLNNTKINNTCINYDGIIQIYGTIPNQDWDDYNFITGSGSFSDPYVIQDLIINVNNKKSGIYIENTTDYFRIENCTIFNINSPNSESGGIKLVNAKNGLLIHNNCSNSGGHGVLVDSCTNITILDNIFTENINNAICCIYSQNITLSENFCANCSSEGILSAYSNEITISNNTCTDNSASGIFIVYTNYSTIAENLCNNNQENGIYLWTSHYNRIIKNNCSDNDDDGIELYDMSYNNTITENVCVRNYDGIYLQLFNVNNTINLNICSNNIYTGIDLYCSFYTCIIDNNCSFNGYFGIWVYYCRDANLILENNCSDNGLDGINVYYGCKSQIILNNTCLRNNHGITIDYGSWNNTIAGNICKENYFAGIKIWGSSHHNKVEANLCLFNEQRGILVANNVHNNTIVGNNCSFTNGDGILVEGANNNTLINNTCNYNVDGIEISSCTNTSIIWNYCANNNGRGILISDSLELDVKWNTIINNNEWGIGVFTTSYSEISLNNCTANGDGIKAVFGTNNTFIENIIWNNLVGLSLEQINYTIIWKNTCSFNNQNGITIIDSSFNQISSNNCSYNTEWGVFLDANSGNNEIFNNYLIENLLGCILNNGANNEIYNNDCILVTPTILTPSQTIYTDRLLIEWTTVNGADNYSVYVNGIFNVSSTNSNEIIILWQNGTYIITVKAISQFAESKESNPIAIIVEMPPHPPNIPDPPIIITSSQTITTDRLLIQWTTVNRADSYYVYVNSIFNVSSLDNEETIIFWNNGTYIITITAVNASGESIPSNPITIIVLIPPTQPNIPFPPNILTPDHTIIINQVLVRWTNVQNADYYNIYINSILNETSIINEAWIIFWGNGTYDITVTAVNATGESIPSNILTMTIKLYPYKLQWFKPIHIDNNWTETLLTYEWCSGSGSYNDPFIIQNLIIDTGGIGNGILIENTMEYFRIENCIIMNYGSNSEDAGIKLIGLTKGLIKNINCTGPGSNGIWAYAVNNITIEYTLCSNNQVQGIYIRGTETILSHNLCSNNGNGIMISTSSDIIISANNCTLNYAFGIDIFSSDSVFVIENQCFNNTYTGILLGISNSTIRNNTCYCNGQNGIDGNMFNTTMENNICFNNNINGLRVFGTNNTITWNKCFFNNHNGLYLWSCNISLVIWNNCSNNQQYGIYLDTGSENNNVVDNLLKANSLGCIHDDGINNNKVNNICILPAPTLTTSSQTITIDNLIINWTLVMGAHNYSVYINYVFYTNSLKCGITIIFPGNGLYTITLTALNEFGESDFSDVITIIVNIPPTEPPEAPVIITQNQTIITDRIVIHWNTILGADNYTVYVNGNYYGTTSLSQLELIFNTDDTYLITVTANNIIGESIKSNTVKIIVDMTPEVEPPPTPAIPGFNLLLLLFVNLISILATTISFNKKKKKL